MEAVHNVIKRNQRIAHARMAMSRVETICHQVSFDELMTIEGDVGARHLIARHPEAVTEVSSDGQSAFLDIDTPEALELARQG